MEQLAGYVACPMDRLDLPCVPARQLARWWVRPGSNEVAVPGVLQGGEAQDW